ncbi:uncharacterized protein LOC141591535 [Silene latifolia]|uniref:uncharacterized protein LOC141591535 n=1 Tax=Silene latifolia TaxID=37657 RepID=UPI003D780A7B
MSSQIPISDKLTYLDKKITIFSDKNISTLCKPLIIAGLFLFIYYILVSNHHINHPPQYLSQFRQKLEPLFTNNQSIDIEVTNISHIAIGIAGSVDLWKYRKSYIESWWEPNITKGYLFLDREPTTFAPWPKSSPPYKIYEDTSRYEPYNRHPMRLAIRMVRVIVETFRELHEGVRWYVMADDDTILFMSNLVDVLGKYDHRKYVYIGENSETIQSNIDNSFEMAFGGAGYAISYPLAEALAKNMDVCIKRYPFVYGSDHLMQSCVADLGVSLTHEKGFHQIDLRRDLSGLLAAHPQAPVLSLHHLDAVDPIFPKMERSEALNHLMKAAKVDESRLFQQTICYEKTKNWSFSIAWGYTAHVYEKLIPPSILEKPLETFSPWRKPSKTPFLFNTRWLNKNPCDMPHVFYLDSMNNVTENDPIVSSFTRKTLRTLPPCSPVAPPPSSSGGGGGGVLSDIVKLIVVSPPTKYNVEVGDNRRECCDVLLDQNEKNVTMIKYRACMKNEIVGVDET